VSRRLIALALVAAVCSCASSWVIVRKDGTRIECDTPFVITGGTYTYLGEDGEPHSVAAEDVDVVKTDAANSGVTALGGKGAALAVGVAAASGPPPRDFVISFKEPFPALPGTTWSAYGLQPAEERFSVHIPDSYTGREPFGLMVYIDAEDRNEGVPAGWAPVLEEKKLLFVAAQGSGDRRRISRRLGLAVLGALEMKKNYYIDRNRIYAAGFAGGARVAAELAFYEAGLIEGAILNSGAEFYERVAAGAGQGMVRVPPKHLAAVRRKTHFALITGSGDPRRGNILDIYSRGYRAHGFHAKLFDVEGMGREMCGAPTLAQAIDYLEQR
jgi:hypothetical protein